MSKAKAFRTTKACTSATEYVKIRYTNCYFISVQKQTAGERMVVANDENGDCATTEDILLFPYYGASPVPFEVTFFIRKVAAGDNNDLLINVILGVQ